MPVAELPLDQFLEPATKRQILARVLRNLKGIYRETDKPERMLEVLNRMLLVTPEAAARAARPRLRLPAPGVLAAGAARTSPTISSASPMRPTWTRCASG